MGCIKLDILDQQYKRTELKVSNFKKELTPKLQTEKVYIYLLHGESWIDQRNTGWNAMYTFSGKERDEETGYSYFGSRYYNSDLSIWLSVDPQAGRYPSLSPYAYCANNPVMYTDPNGEFFWIPMVIGAVVYGIANTVIHHSQGDINNFWQGLGYFALGAINGAIAGATWSAGIAGIQAASTFANVAGWTMIGAKAVNAVSTIASGIANTENAWQIMWGKAYVDNIGQAFLRNSWEGLQTWAGYNFTQFRNAAGDVDKVERWGGATFAIAENVTDFKGWQGVSLGNYINIQIEDKLDKNYPGGWIYSKDGLFLHEYGHTFDSRRFGPLYLPVIGSASARAKDGNYTWCELRANNHVFKYMKKRGLLDNWDDYERNNPLKKKQ